MGRALTILAALAAVFASTSAAAAHGGGDVAVTLAGTPNPVTAGGTVAYVTTMKNTGSRALQHVALDAPAPASMSVVSVISSATCTTSATGATCLFGTVAAGGSVSATVIMTVSSTPGTIGSSVTWSNADGDDDDLPVTATTSIAVQAPSPNAISEYVLPAGGNVNTGTTTSRANPQSTGADVPATPAGVATSLSEVNAASPADACGPGAKCFGQISVVTVAAPPFPAADPLHLTFRIDSSELPRHFDADDVKKLRLYHDSVLVPNCTGAPGVASPASCVSARRLMRPKHCRKGRFTVEIDVLSTTNGRWRT
jgi:hypothetical protein